MSPAKILVVDDDPEIQALLRKYLSSEGYEVYVSGDGREALMMIKNDDFDLAVLDKILPEIDGFKLCRLIKSEKRSSKMPVMILTALTDTKNKLAGFESRADDYETKPIEKDSFLRKVKKLLSGEKEQQ